MPELDGLTSADFDALFEPLSGFDHILAAVSGGVDSTVLLYALCRWARDHAAMNMSLGKSRLKISVACVDHALREGSAQEALSVQQKARLLGCDCAILRWSGEKPETGLQEKARDVRYGLLKKHAHQIGATALVVAHHADDQAETILMRMAAGSGPDGLIGMRMRTDWNGLVLLRPFLEVSKSTLIATARAADLEWHEDPSNQLERFERVRLRKLQSLRDGAGLKSSRLGRLSWRLQRQQEALEWMVAQQWTEIVAREKTGFILLAAFWTLPAEIRMRMISKAVNLVVPGVAFRLERLESLQMGLTAWATQGKSGRRTLGGCVFSLSSAGLLTILPETQRRKKQNEQV
jgi:tRNA(Ile)-lysidine synthase